jgi:signal transduction histidine kinase
LIQAKLSLDNPEVDELLQKLGKFTNTLFTGTRDFIWSIDPKSDKINEMLIYIKDFGEELFEYSGINFYVDTNDAFETNVKLPVGWSRHVVFIIKEAMTNSLKHAKCKNVHMNFNVIDGKFVFEFKDDGVGLNGHHDKVYLGMGLQNMKERARKIGSEIVISSENGKGTVIVLKGKIPHNE